MAAVNKTPPTPPRPPPQSGAKKTPYTSLAVGLEGGGQGSPSSVSVPDQVHAFDKKLEEMSNQVMQWQKQHQSDLKMLAAKEEQLRAFQEEMSALKENLLADEKEVGASRLLVTSSQPSLAPTPRPQHLHDQMTESLWWGWECLGARRGHPRIRYKAGSLYSRLTAST